MDKRGKIKALVEEIKAISDNIKSEIIVAGILEAGVSRKSLQIELVGNFTRPYSKDLLEAVAVERHRNQFKLKLKISRNGIYDLLPEGVTHSQQIQEEGAEEISILTQGCKLRKSEEVAARKFFSPFEQEFFLYGVKLEQEEHKMFFNSSSIFCHFLTEFWNISEELESAYKAILLRIMPYVHEIAGDINTITNCLERILEVPVNYNLEHRTVHFKSEFNTLANSLLGRNFTVGSCLYAIPYTIFNVGPIPNYKSQQFLPGGETAKFIEVFFKYTMPFETEIVTNILIQKTQTREKETDFGILGYSTTI